MTITNGKTYLPHLFHFGRVFHAILESTEEILVDFVVFLAVCVGRTSFEFKIVDRFAFGVAVCHDIWLRVQVHTVSAAKFTMVLADLGRKLNAALSSLNRASVVDEKVHLINGSRLTSPDFLISASVQVLDATLKEITAALLESDVNVKLVASLRQKVKTKVKAALDGSDKSKDSNRKSLIQKVGYLFHWQGSGRFALTTNRPFLMSWSTW